MSNGTGLLSPLLLSPPSPWPRSSCCKVDISLSWRACSGLVKRNTWYLPRMMRKPRIHRHKQQGIFLINSLLATLNFWHNHSLASFDFWHKRGYRKGNSIRQAPVFRYLRVLLESPWKFIIWMNECYYTACCWFPTSSNILILLSHFWQIRFESYWSHCSSAEYWCSYGTIQREIIQPYCTKTHNNTMAMARLYCMHSHNP